MSVRAWWLSTGLVLALMLCPVATVQAGRPVIIRGGNPGIYRTSAYSYRYGLGTGYGGTNRQGVTNPAGFSYTAGWGRYGMPPVGGVYGAYGYGMGMGYGSMAAYGYGPMPAYGYGYPGYGFGSGGYGLQGGYPVGNGYVGYGGYGLGYGSWNPMFGVGYRGFYPW
ncbi:MAG TPA: hypothetical protein VFT74_03900 [Isosphaeraceae bacterium]|nr:hypothetical protein [Isosphaeraceae bacterium]